MKGGNQLTVPKWPFFVADGIVVLCAWLVFQFASKPPGPGTGAMVILLLLLGAVLAVAPFLLEWYWNCQQQTADADDEEEAGRQALLDVTERLTRLAGVIQHTAQAGEQVAEVAAALREVQGGLEQHGAKLGRQISEIADIEKKRATALESRVEQLVKRVEARVKSLESAVGSLQAKLESVIAEVPAGSKERTRGDDEPRGNSEENEQTEKGANDRAGAVLTDGARPRAKASERAVGAVEANSVTGGNENGAADVAKDRDEGADPGTARRTRSKPRVQEEPGGALFSTTTLVATAFIGAGNKLYVRGEGPGLSWEEGVPMQFVEIGKWSWSTTEATGPISVRVLKNDEDEDRKGLVILEPGQTVSTRPEFDG